jgi:hypothetical protein
MRDLAAVAYERFMGRKAPGDERLTDSERNVIAIKLALGEGWRPDSSEPTGWRPPPKPEEKP